MEPIVQFFKKQFESKRLSPCWIIKVKDAEYLPDIKNIARQILYTSDQQPHGLPNSYIDKLLEQNAYPNFLQITKPIQDDGSTASEIKLEQAKLLTAFVKKKPAIDSWRVVIIDKIEDMNRFAANSILKSVEEPPSRTLMLFISKQFGLMLPTIRSRCKVVELTGESSESVFVSNEEFHEKVERIIIDSLLSKNLHNVVRNIKDFSSNQKTFDTCVKHVLYILYKKSVNCKQSIKAVDYPLGHWVKAYEAVNLIFSNTINAHLNLNQLLTMIFSAIKAPEIMLKSSICNV